MRSRPAPPLLSIGLSSPSSCSEAQHSAAFYGRRHNLIRHFLTAGNYSISFGCNIGVRQGKDLFPLLFSIYPNGLAECMSNAYNWLSLINNWAHCTLDTEVMVFVRLYLLLYADDTVLLVESPQELPAARALWNTALLYHLKIGS